MDTLTKHWDKYVIELESRCFVWIAGCAGNGRPSIRVGLRSEGRCAHVARLVCEDVYGPPPFENWHAAHKPPCTNVKCINPAHLYWATPSQNSYDKPVHVRRKSYNLMPDPTPRRVTRYVQG